MKRLPDSSQGSALLGVMLFSACVLGLISTLFMRVHRFQQAAQQNAAWVEAIYAARAGLDCAAARLGTTATPLAFTLSGSLEREGEGASVSTYQTELSVSLNNGLSMLRLRSTGRTPLAGARYPLMLTRSGGNGSIDRLRPFYYHTYQGTRVGTPFAERSLEAVLSLGLKKWKHALLAQDALYVQGTSSVADSYDTSDSLKSSLVNGMPGQYDVAKRQRNALVATLANSLGSVNLRGQVYGDVATNGLNLISGLLSLPAGLLSGNQVRLTGNLLNNYRTPMEIVSKPTWQPNGMYGGDDLQNADRTLYAGTDATPARYKFTEVSRKVTILPPVGQSSGVAEIWVTGNLNAGNPNDITVAQGVKAIFYVESGVSLHGAAVRNESRNPANVVFLGVRQSGSSSFNVNGNGDVWGVVYAPLHNLSYSGGQQLFGSFAGKSITLNNTVLVHYDEALNKLGAGLGELNLISYLEDLP